MWTSQSFRRTGISSSILKTADMEKDKVAGNLWLAKWDGSENRHSHMETMPSRKIDILTYGRHDEFLPAWSPNGNEIAFVTKRGDDPDRTVNWDVWVVGAKPGAAERQVTTSPEADPDPDWESAPAWSPDGKTIAYIHGGDPKKVEYAVHTLAVIPAAGGGAKVLTQNLDRNVVQP